MGMFDYIKCEYPLPELPSQVIAAWEGAEKVAFQSKDTPEQSMTFYKIDVDGHLWRQHRTTRWVEPADANAESVMDRLGHLETLSTWWEKESFTGTIDFYESYHHDEYPKGEPLDSNKWKRFVDGWIEYTAIFCQGQLVNDIAVSRNELARKLTDEEYSAQIKQWAQSRKEWDDNFRERRCNHPTPEQKLIDGIYDFMKPFSITVSGQKDRLIEEILGRIEAYRDVHDRYYKKNN